MMKRIVPACCVCLSTLMCVHSLPSFSRNGYLPFATTHHSYSYRQAYQQPIENDEAGELLISEKDAYDVSDDNSTTNASSANNRLVTTLAGNGHTTVSETGAIGKLSSPSGVAVDAAGNVYVADAANNRIQKILPNGTISIFAGNGQAGSTDGTVKASFNFPSGVAVDAAGNVYVADKGNHKIRKITPDGLVSTLAGSGQRNDVDGSAKEAAFDKPVSVAVDAAGNIYVADQCNHKIRKVTPNGIVSTLAGNGHLGHVDGMGIAASFYDPSAVAVDEGGNVYVADYSNNCIRKITPQGVVSTIAGGDAVGSSDGSALEASFYFPDGIAVDASGNVYIADQVNNKIRMLSSAGVVSTIAGSGTAGSEDGAGSSASFNYPAGLAVDTEGSLFVADLSNHKVRKIAAKPADMSQPQPATIQTSVAVQLRP
jgi:serine/threonine protein kinase, bacterial